MTRNVIFAILLANCSLWGQAVPAAAPAQKSPSTPAAPASRTQPTKLNPHAQRYYGLVWGVDLLSVRAVESGEIIRFSYRVLDADKAKILNDKQNIPSLIDPQARVKLVVPELEQVGMLRQTPPPEAGKSYWMAFSNSGRLVKRGDRVDVVIGLFRAQGLIVE
jgi:hypothetical protein